MSDLAFPPRENVARAARHRDAGIREPLRAGDDQVGRGCPARARTPFVVARWKAREEADRPAEPGAVARIARVNFQQGRLVPALPGFAEVVEGGESLAEARGVGVAAGLFVAFLPVAVLRRPAGEEVA